MEFPQGHSPRFIRCTKNGWRQEYHQFISDTFLICISEQRTKARNVTKHGHFIFNVSVSSCNQAAYNDGLTVMAGNGCFSRTVAEIHSLCVFGKSG